MVGVKFPIDILDMVVLDDFCHILRIDKDSMEMFPVNKIVAITDHVLITVDLV